VARRLLEAMGGALELGTAPTGGARVRLVLPAAAGA
jgi:signal transduction histidine kinase